MLPHVKYTIRRSCICTLVKVPHGWKARTMNAKCKHEMEVENARFIAENAELHVCPLGITHEEGTWADGKDQSVVNEWVMVEGADICSALRLVLTCNHFLVEEKKSRVCCLHNTLKKQKNRTEQNRKEKKRKEKKRTEHTHTQHTHRCFKINKQNK